jgi:hypothetical protein
VIYLPQEGRGIGLANKVAAYSLQELGLDTVDANREVSRIPSSMTLHDPSLPPCLPASLPSCLPASLPPCFPASLPPCLPASLTHTIHTCSLASRTTRGSMTAWGLF